LSRSLRLRTGVFSALKRSSSRPRSCRVLQYTSGHGAFMVCLSAAVMTKCLNLDSFMHFMKRRRRNYLVTPFLLGTKLLTWIRSNEFNPILSRKIEELPEPSRTRSYDAAVSSKVERLYGATADARGHALTPWHGAPVSASACTCGVQRATTCS
jgi:hypothetical protein